MLKLFNFSARFLASISFVVQSSLFPIDGSPTLPPALIRGPKTKPKWYALKFSPIWAMSLKALIPKFC